MKLHWQTLHPFCSILQGKNESIRTPPCFDTFKLIPSDRYLILQKALRDLDGIWMPASFCLQLIMQVSGVFPEYLQAHVLLSCPVSASLAGGSCSPDAPNGNIDNQLRAHSHVAMQKRGRADRYGLHVPQIHGVNIKFADWKQFLVWPVIFTWTTTKTAIGHTISTRNCAHTSNHNLPPSFSLYTSQK